LENTSNGTTDSGSGSGSDSGSSSPAPSTSSNEVSPQVAGVIGAAVTIGVIVLAIAAAVLFGGLRVHRSGDKRITSSFGGFKGAEKLASDTDLTIAKGGAGPSIVRHERVGSWELGEAQARDAKNSSLDRVVSGADYGKKDDDDISVVNAFGAPVKIDDHV